MKVFGYLRVSSKGQVDGDGFDRQRAAIDKFCESRGWIVRRWFSEPAVPGATDHDERPAFTEMLSMMGGAQPDVFVVECADRLARDLVVSELLLAEVKKRNLIVWSAAGELDLTNCSDPTRVLIRQLMGALAQWDKSNLVRKLRAARDRKRARGERCEGPKPYELRDAKGSEVCQSIYEMRTRGLTFKEIAQWLSQTKTPTPAGKLYWHKSSVESIYARYARRFHRAEHGSKPNPNQVLVDLRHVLPESEL